MTTPLRTLKIMLLDDHDVVVHGISSLLSSQKHLQVIGTFTQSRALLNALKVREPDILLLDYALSPKENDGVNLIKVISARYPKISILVVSSHYNSATVVLALRAGAKGFFGKHQNPQDLITAIDTISKQKIYLDSEMARKVTESKNTAHVPVNSHSHTPDSIGKITRNKTLSVREQEVLRCILEGMTVSEIAEKFSKSIKTISRQKQDAMKKLGISSDHELYIKLKSG
ncbi:response regulator [Photobacterium halotolerans]|uniref:response regulator n=1 Tax=Photobacterium halotolerans TaxID=265726 RepID=UPI000480DB7A|nr:response regulator transcription factor [Photobacterium halotolerans]